MRPDSRVLVAVALLAAACTTGEPAATSSPRATAEQDTAGATEEATEVVRLLDEVPSLHPSVDDWDTGTVEIVAEDGTVHRVLVRLATTDEQRTHGLMEVPDLPDGAGMWFAYDTERAGGFWMKDTLVPLDIAYVGADGTIVDVADAEPCTSSPCPTYPPDAAYRNVLEVPNGYLAGIGAGEGAAARLVRD
jgi:uncharacterized membrane protein (UPF0127 family)